MAHTAERGWAWFRRRQGAVRVVDCRGCSMETVQFLLVRPVNPIKNLANIIPSSKTMVGWRLEQGANWQAWGQGIICQGVRVSGCQGVRVSGRLNFLSIH